MKDKKKNILKLMLISVFLIVGLVLLSKFLLMICEKEYIALLWWLAITFMIGGLLSFFLANNTILKKKKYRRILIGKIIFTSVGLILFIINSFIFINDIFTSITLVVSVGLIYSSLIFVQVWMVNPIYSKGLTSIEKNLTDEEVSKNQEDSPNE